MKNIKTRHRFDEYTILEVFLVVVLFGLLSAALFVGIFPGTATAPVLVAPSMDDYRAAAASATEPFLTAVSSTTAESIKANPAEFAGLAAAAHTAMLAVRVPASERQAHLSAVLLIDRWKVALAANNSDFTSLIDQTNALIVSYPWLMGVPAPAAEDLKI